MPFRTKDEKKKKGHRYKVPVNKQEQQFLEIFMEEEKIKAVSKAFVSLLPYYFRYKDYVEKCKKKDLEMIEMQEKIRKLEQEKLAIVGRIKKFKEAFSELTNL